MAQFGNKITQNIAQRLRQVVGQGKDFVPLHTPEFLGREKELVLDTIESGWVSSVGKYVDDFEAGIADVCGVSHGVAVANGTVALQICMLVAGVQPEDEVLIPALTFVATANAVSHIGATPHFVDSAYDTLGLCPIKLAAHLNEIVDVQDGRSINRKTGKTIRAIVPVHVFGCPVDMDGLCDVAQRFNLVIVEDAAESLGSTYKGRACGSLGDIAALSFIGNKIITTGGGGVVVTDNPDWGTRAKHITTTAKTTHRWAFEHDEIAFNFRMPNLNAALGCAQLEQLDARLLQKQALFQAYRAAFFGFDDLTIFEAPANSYSNYWLNCLILSGPLKKQRDTLLDGLNDCGLMCRPVWNLMHGLSMYAECPRADLSVAEDLAQRIINIPSSSYLANASSGLAL